MSSCSVLRSVKVAFECDKNRKDSHTHGLAWRLWLGSTDIEVFVWACCFFYMLSERKSSCMNPPTGWASDCLWPGVDQIPDGAEKRLPEVPHTSAPKLKSDYKLLALFWFTIMMNSNQNLTLIINFKNESLTYFCCPCHRNFVRQFLGELQKHLQAVEANYLLLGHQEVEPVHSIQWRNFAKTFGPEKWVSMKLALHNKETFICKIYFESDSIRCIKCQRNALSPKYMKLFYWALLHTPCL